MNGPRESGQVKRKKIDQADPPFRQKILCILRKLKIISGFPPTG